MPLDNLSPYGLWLLPRNGIRLIGGFHGVLLSPRTQLFSDLVIAAVVCGGGCMGVRGVYVQIRSAVMVALVHCVLSIPVRALALSYRVSHLTIPSAVQSNTVQTASCFTNALAGLMDYMEPVSIATKKFRSPAIGIHVYGSGNVIRDEYGLLLLSKRQSRCSNCFTAHHTSAGEIGAASE
jgi:hypothetical protein